MVKDLDVHTVTELYRHFVADILDMLDRSRHRIIICFDPPGKEESIRNWLEEKYEFWPQKGRDLGEKMAHAFSRAFSSGMTGALLMGTDVPDLPGTVIEEGFARLRDHEAVIGPAQDGGYYLIGFNSRTFTPQVFEGIAWSTPTVLEKTLAVLEKAGAGFHFLPQWRDMDEYADLLHLMAESPAGPEGSKTLGYLSTIPFCCPSGERRQMKLLSNSIKGSISPRHVFSS
jgi:rSAM/selenodomain-associated transferase 1